MAVAASCGSESVFEPHFQQFPTLPIGRAFPAVLSPSEPLSGNLRLWPSLRIPFLLEGEDTGSRAVTWNNGVGQKQVWHLSLRIILTRDARNPQRTQIKPNNTKAKENCTTHLSVLCTLIDRHDRGRRYRQGSPRRSNVLYKDRDYRRGRHSSGCRYRRLGQADV